ncbi:transglycosylase SLT domain-containing protein [Paenibacillus sp. JSM ZJ436]|uniref:transglycosylase SLT domain-containing protein n=1 Tax=Paenibacillus sp. JSM ZJ436 TaxID=3376190 RepID=UPI0037A6E0B3
MRIRGVSEEGEDLTNLLPTLESKFASVGLTLKKNDDTFKSTYEIFEDLSTVWNQLSDMQQAEFVELVAGKHQGNIAASMIANWKDAQLSLQAGLNSFGSAARENEVYLESMQGKIAKFRNAVNTFWSDSISNEFLKSMIDAGTALITHIDNLAVAIGLLIGSFMLFKHKAIGSFLLGAGQTVKALFGMQVAANSAAASMTVLQKAMGWVGIAITAGSLLYTFFNQSKNSADEAAQSIDNLKNTVTEATYNISQLESLNEQLKDTSKSQEEQLAIYDQMRGIMPEIVDYYNDEGDAVYKKGEAVDALIQKEKDLLAAQEKTLAMRASEILDAPTKTIAEAKKSISDDKAKLQFANASKQAAEYMQEFMADNKITIDQMLDLDNRDKLNEMQAGIEQIFTDLGLKTKDLKKFKLGIDWSENKTSFDQFLKNMQDNFSSLNESYNVNSAKIEEGKRQYVETLDTINKDVMNDAKTNDENLKMVLSRVAERYINSVDITEDNKDQIVSNYRALSDNITKEIENNKIDLVTLFETGDLTALSDILSQFGNETLELTSILDAFKKSTDETSKSLTLFNTIVSQRMNELSKTKSNITLLNKAQQELKDTNGVSIETMLELTDAYADYAEVSNLSKESILEYIKAKKQEEIATSEAENNKAKAIVAGARAQIVAMRAVNAVSIVPAIPENAFDAAEEVVDKLAKKFGILDSAVNDLRNTSDKADEETQKSNETISETNELLTTQQKRLRDVELALDKLQSGRSRFEKGSKEYQKSIQKEIDLLQEQKDIYDEGVKNPRTLLSTKVTSTSQVASGTGASDSDVSNMISTVLGLQGNFRYEQIPGEFNGSFEEFVERKVSDCSQFIQEAFEGLMNIKLPRTAAEQAKQGVAVSKDNLKRGDLVFFNTTGKANSHVGMYTGNGKFIQMGTNGLAERNLNDKEWSGIYNGARRVINDTSSTAALTSSKSAYTGQYSDLINKYAGKHNIDPFLIAAIIKTESNFKSNAVSSAGAQGLMQLMPNTAKGLGVTNSFDPEQNIKAGTGHFARLLEKYNNDVELALYAYNAGEGNVDKWIKNGQIGNIPFEETRNYAPKVMSAYGQQSGGVLSTKYKYTPPSESDLEQARIDAERNRDKTAEEIYKLMIDSIDGQLYQFVKNRDSIDQKIGQSEFKQSKYSESSAEWRKEEMSQISYLTQQQEQLHKENLMLDKLVAEKQITSGEFDERRAKNSAEWLKLEEEKNEKRFSVLLSSLEKYNQKRDEISKNIESSESRAGQMDTASAEYRKELERQISYKKQIIEQDEQEIAVIKEKLKNTKLLPKDIEELKARLEEVEYNKLTVEVEIKEKKSDMFDSYRERISDQVQAKENELQIIENDAESLASKPLAYTKAMLQRIPVYDELIKLTEDEIALIEKKLDQDDLTSAKAKELKQDLVDLRNQQMGYNISIKETTDRLYELANSNITDIFDAIKKSFDTKDMFDVEEFNDSIDSIISTLDQVDGIYDTGVNFVDTSAQTRSDLKDYASKVKDIASEVKSAMEFSIDLSSVNFSNLSSLGSQITSQINLIGNLKRQIDDMNDSIRDTELQYRRQEAALEEVIKTTEKSYDSQIERQQEILEGLDEQIEKEDRLKKLQELNDEINKVRNDKRFSYITEAGEEILTYDKARVEELEKEKDELVKQYERDDVKQAIQDEIDRLEKQKQETVQILQEKLDRTRQINQQSLEAMRLYQSSLSSLYSQTVSDTQSKMAELQSALEKGLADGTITAEEGSKLLQLVVDGWQSSSLQKWDIYITQVKAKLADLKKIYDEMAIMAANMGGGGSAGGGSGGGGSNNTNSTNQNNSSNTNTNGTTNSTNSSGNNQQDYLNSLKQSGSGAASWANQYQYLNSVANGNNAGAAKWAEEQMKKNGMTKYHTGGEVGLPPLKPNEMPAILEKGEWVLTDEHMSKLKNKLSITSVINSQLTSLKNMLSNIKPNTPTLANAGTSYSFSGDITVQANNPSEFFKGLETHIKSHRK